MVRIKNIIWLENGMVEAIIYEDGDKEKVYRIVIDCIQRKLVNTDEVRMNEYVWRTLCNLADLYEEGRQPREWEVMWY